MADKLLLRHDQMAEYKEEKERIDTALANPLMVKALENPAKLKQHSARIGKILNEQAPKPVTGAERDRLVKRERELRAKWTEGMPSGETMRKNPPGAVDHHRKWERHNKKSIIEWKNIRRQIEPDNDDRDLANIEVYRPEGAADRMRSDAQIAGHMTFGSVPQENWDNVFDPEKGPNSALKQVAEGKKKRKELSPEQKAAASARLAAGRAKRMAEKAAATQLDVAMGVVTPELSPTCAESLGLGATSGEGE